MARPPVCNRLPVHFRCPNRIRSQQGRVPALEACPVEHIPYDPARSVIDMDFVRYRELADMVAVLASRMETPPALRMGQPIAGAMGQSALVQWVHIARYPQQRDSPLANSWRGAPIAPDFGRSISIGPMSLRPMSMRSAQRVDNIRRVSPVRRSFSSVSMSML